VRVKNNLAVTAFQKLKVVWFNLLNANVEYTPHDGDVTCAGKIIKNGVNI